MSPAVSIIFVLSLRTLQKQTHRQPLPASRREKHLVTLPFKLIFVTPGLVTMDLTQQDSKFHNQGVKYLRIRTPLNLDQLLIKTFSYTIFPYYSMRSQVSFHTQNRKETGLHCTETNISYALSANYCGLLQSVATVNML